MLGRFCCLAYKPSPMWMFWNECILRSHWPWNLLLVLTISVWQRVRLTYTETTGGNQIWLFPFGDGNCDFFGLGKEGLQFSPVTVKYVTQLDHRGSDPALILHTKHHHNSSDKHHHDSSDFCQSCVCKVTGGRKVMWIKWKTYLSCWSVII